MASLPVTCLFVEVVFSFNCILNCIFLPLSCILCFITLAPVKALCNVDFEKCSINKRLFNIHPSIGGIETELVVSRGQEILTRALCRLPAGGRTHTFRKCIYTDCTVENLCGPQMFVNACIHICEHTHLCSPLSPHMPHYPLEQKLRLPWDTNYLHTDTTVFISYEQIQVLSVQVEAVCQQFVSK